MSWSVLITGKKADVSAELRGYKDTPNIYPDAQRDALLAVAADAVDALQGDYYDGAYVEGSGHQGASFTIKMTPVKIASPPIPVDPPGTVTGEPSPEPAATATQAQSTP